ncbi:MAG: hypothetical protein HY722_09735 [Planctomycetes bacterium]|nr:hypothetical protein [Planctomycetota bacterium]
MVGKVTARDVLAPASFTVLILGAVALQVFLLGPNREERERDLQARMVDVDRRLGEIRRYKQEMESHRAEAERYRAAVQRFQVAVAARADAPELREALLAQVSGLSRPLEVVAGTLRAESRFAGRGRSQCEQMPFTLSGTLAFGEVLGLLRELQGSRRLLELRRVEVRRDMGGGKESVFPRLNVEIEVWAFSMKGKS